MKKQKYRIIGVIAILILVASIIIIPQVFAIEYITEEEEAVAGTCSDPTYKYGLYIEQDENRGVAQYVLRRDKSSVGSCGKDADGFDPLADDLKITSVSGYGSTAVGQTISMNDEVILGGDSLMVTIGGTSTLKVTLGKPNAEEEEESGGGLFGWITGVVEEWVDSSITVKYSVVQEESFSYPIDTSTLETVTSVTGSYESSAPPSFDEIVEKAKNAGHNYDSTTVKNTLFGEDESFNGLKCNPDIKDASGNIIDRNQEIELKDASGNVIGTTTNYYQERNSDYFYATETTQGDSLTYTYNYAPGIQKTENKGPVCERTCEEAVKVEYGMPVASKAGLCFEYKVKVTSYVKCKTTITAEAPQKPSGSYCNPAPKCQARGGGALRKLPQAGPTEEFDNCINECDGGKYSEKCSLKCYKQVYGKNPKTKLSINYEDYSIEKMAAASSYSLATCLEDNKKYYGCYYKSGGKMLWASYTRNQNGSGSAPTYNLSDLGRWYLDQNGYNLWNLRSNSGSVCNAQTATRCYVADAQGFFRRDYRNSGLCTDECSWRTDQCAGQYLNPGTALKDYEDNLNKYQAAVASCEVAATCSTTTAEFTISVDYTEKGTGTKKTVKFPYSTGKDKLPSRGTGITGGTSSSDDTTIIDFAGCYKDSGVDNEYMTEWGFPGAWIHNKTGDVQYEPTSAEGYHFESGKYCLPLNAADVNAEWWEYAETTGCYVNVPDPTEWNIMAETKDFGYFGWNIRMRCFYAVANEVCDLDINGCCTNIPPPGGGGGPTPTPDDESTVINYRIRSVDLDNLFPNAGTRETGFNWTNKAQIPADKDPNYSIDIDALVADIQAKGTAGTYTDNELEYSFELTPEILREIRSDNKRKGYDWDYGTYSKRDDRSVNFYNSDFFGNFFSSSEMKKNAVKGKNNSYIGGGY